MMNSSPTHITLSAKDLSIGYTSNSEVSVIADHINIELESRKLVGLVGANGIGKSTLLRTLTKMQAPLSGEIFINNMSLHQLNLKQLAQQLSIVLTEPLLTKNLSVYELVALGRSPYTNWIGHLTPEDHKQVKKALERLGIENLKHKRCYQLSDGQLQKAMIARAIAQDTDLIILDEPTTHLDMYHKAYILKLLKDLTEETGKTILFSTHEIDLAIQLCDTMMVMTDQQVFCNDPCQLIEDQVFNSLFPKDLITFNKFTGKFTINK